MKISLPDFGVKDRTVLITGAGRGIGLAIARALAAGGAAVAIQDIDEDVARREADAINAAGGRAVGLGGDLADLTLPERLVERVTAAFGPISILVNNGSIQSWDAFGKHPVERMRRELDANVIAVTRLCQLVLPAMREAKWGRIVNFSSIQVRKGNAHAPAYVMSRAAMETLTRSLAREFSRDGVTANCIAPGYFDTFRNSGHLVNDQIKQERGRHLPVGRLGRPDDCAGLCLLLCSRAGEYVTGQTLCVDGGMSVQ